MLGAVLDRAWAVLLVISRLDEAGAAHCSLKSQHAMASNWNAVFTDFGADGSGADTRQFQLFH